MRQGYNPLQLQKEDKEGKLRQTTNLLEEDSEYYMGKYNFPEEEQNYYKQVFKFFDKTGADQVAIAVEHFKSGSWLGNESSWLSGYRCRGGHPVEKSGSIQHEIL